VNRQNTGAEYITAFADNGIAVVAVGSGGTIYRSTNGLSWAQKVSGTTDQFNSVAWSPALGLFIAVGQGGTVRTSPTGETWSSPVSGTISFLLSVAA
jgi:hypothetical protein